MSPQIATKAGWIELAASTAFWKTLCFRVEPFKRLDRPDAEAAAPVVGHSFRRDLDEILEHAELGVGKLHECERVHGLASGTAKVREAGSPGRVHR